MAEMTDAAWAASVAAGAAGLNANHIRIARTVRNKSGVVVLQAVIDVRNNGFTGEANGTDNPLP